MCSAREIKARGRVTSKNSSGQAMKNSAIRKPTPHTKRECACQILSRNVLIGPRKRFRRSEVANVASGGVHPRCVSTWYDST